MTGSYTSPASFILIARGGNGSVNAGVIFGIADTVRDASLEAPSQAPFFAYGFRSRGGKVIVAYWLGERTHPKHPFEPVYVDLILRNTGIVHPVLIDIDSDRILPLAWETAPTSVLRHVPVRDSVMAIADESYFD